MAKPNKKIKYEVLNIMAAIELKQEMDLKHISEVIKGAEYKPESFEGLIYRPPWSYAVVVLRKDGKAICTNVKSMEEVEKVFGGFIEELKRAGVLKERKTCPSCGAILEEEDLVCLECGYVFPPPK